MLDMQFPGIFALNILGQDLVPADLVIVGLLVVLEGLLSIDNALVLGMLVKRLPKDQRVKALYFGLLGAFVFRFIAILMAGFLMKWTFVKFFGGAYLVFIAVKHLFLEHSDGADEKLVLDEAGQPKIVDAETGESLDTERENIEIEQRVPIAANLVTQDGVDNKTYEEGAVCDVKSHHNLLFWKAVLVIEVTDIAFAVDSILAAIALAGSRSEKLWVVVTGGILGVILMRFAAQFFVRLLERFPRFEIAAYLLVVVIGLKLLADWAFNSDWSFQGHAWMGQWQNWFQGLENTRLQYVEGYEKWLIKDWPFGMSEHQMPQGNMGIVHVPHLLDFHDFRRPECFGFWLVMLACFFVGFIPRRERSATAS